MYTLTHAVGVITCKRGVVISSRSRADIYGPPRPVGPFEFCAGPRREPSFVRGNFPHVAPPLGAATLSVSMRGACVMRKWQQVPAGRSGDGEKGTCEGERDDNLQWVVMCISVCLPQAVLKCSVLIHHCGDGLGLHPETRCSCSHFGCHGNHHDHPVNTKRHSSAVSQ